MDAPTFVYTTYLRTTPQKLWQALTEPAFTRRYWATEFTTDWSVGSPKTWDNHAVLISDPEQVVLEAEPYSRLSYTWHAITPELAKRFGWDDELLARLSGGRAERHPEAAVAAVGAHGVAPVRLLGAAPHRASATSGAPAARRVVANWAGQRMSWSARLPASRRVKAAKISATPWKMAHTPTRVTSVSSDRCQERTAHTPRASSATPSSSWVHQ
jgi:hypothetical protein